MTSNRYKDREWLYDTYWHEEQSMGEIAEACGVSDPTILYWMRKYDIPRREHGKAIHVAKRREDPDLPSYAYTMLEGLLLGDGYLRDATDYTASFGVGDSRKPFIDFLADLFDDWGFSYYRQDPTSTTSCYTVATHAYPLFKDMYDNWYDQSGDRQKKRLPSYVSLTPLRVLYWYLGDGSFNPPSTASIASTITPSSLERVQEDLFQQGVLTRLYVYSYTSCNKLYIPAGSSNAFFKFLFRDGIGDTGADRVPRQLLPSCYKYKFPRAYHQYFTE